MLRDIFVAIGIGMSQLGAAVQSVAPDDNKSALANLWKSIEWKDRQPGWLTAPHGRRSCL